MKPPARNHQHQNQNQNQSQSSSPGSARSTGRKAASPATNGPSSEPELRERMSAAVTAIASQSANILLHSGKVRHVPITSTVDYLRCRLPLLPITPTAHFLCRLRPVPIASTPDFLQCRLLPLPITSSVDHLRCRVPPAPITPPPPSYQTRDRVNVSFDDILDRTALWLSSFFTKSRISPHHLQNCAGACGARLTWNECGIGSAAVDR